MPLLCAVSPQEIASAESPFPSGHALAGMSNYEGVSSFRQYSLRHLNRSAQTRNHDNARSGRTNRWGEQPGDHPARRRTPRPEFFFPGIPYSAGKNVSQPQRLSYFAIPMEAADSVLSGRTLLRNAQVSPSSFVYAAVIICVQRSLE